ATEAQDATAVSRGDIVDGTIVFIGQEGIAVDIGTDTTSSQPVVTPAPAAQHEHRARIPRDDHGGHPRH
ncbi:hypothetical protein CTI14_60640, partial [Methylobacterium radiotolerans]